MPNFYSYLDLQFNKSKLCVCCHIVNLLYQIYRQKKILRKRERKKENKEKKKKKVRKKEKERERKKERN